MFCATRPRVVAFTYNRVMRMARGNIELGRGTINREPVWLHVV